MKNFWYEAKIGTDQGLVVEEKTGKNIAVTYEKKNAKLIVKAVNSHNDLLEACKFAKLCIEENWNDLSNALMQLKDVIRKAESEIE